MYDLYYDKRKMLQQDSEEEKDHSGRCEDNWLNIWKDTKLQLHFI